VLAVAGAVGGVALAFTLLQLLKQLLVESMARGAEIHINPTVLTAALGISLATGFLATLLPALQFSQIAPAQVMRSGGAAGTSRGQSRLRGALIVAQVAIALGLLVCSGLLMKNLHALRATDLGFDPRNLLTEDVMLTSPEYQKRDVLGTFYNPLLERVRAIPGVEGATLINKLPIAFSGMNADVHIVGHPPAPANQERLAELRFLSPGFEKVLGTRLVRGRLLSDSLDTPTSQTVVTVNESFVRKFFEPGEDPIGKQIDWDKGLTIVGVTSDVRQDLVEAPMAEMDFAAAQQMSTWGIRSAELVIRTKVPPESIVAPLRAAMHQVDPTVPFRPAMTMDDIMNGTLTMQRLESWLFGTFAGLALLLSLVGIYGMVAHEVELKTRDIGIRMALGSTRGLVVRQILQRVATLMLFGIGIGWVLTLALQKVLASVVTLSVAQDAWLLAAITAALALFGVSASFLPARRAASINPIEALRTE
jgi:predicted permease